MSHFESTWQAHRAKACGGCWYCEHPPIGSTAWRLVQRTVPSRQKFGKKLRKQLKRYNILRRMEAREGV